MSIKDAGIWDLLDEYADIRDELDLLHEHLEKCSRRLIRFRRPSRREQEILDEVREYPFGEI